ncbi:MAG TPA: nuclear transport factor 2 family protein [Terriglobales bacterium]|nr:nuclear transport factor 2 family protein [Terriglobales bacterium]
MRAIATGFGIVTLVLLAVSSGMAQESWSKSPQMAIANIEQQWLEHVDDAAVLESVLANDFVHVLPSGVITKQQQIDFMKAHPRSRQETRSFENLKIRVYGDTGIANGVVVTTNSSGTHRTLFTDVFVKRQGRWQAVNAQENPEQPQN